MRAFPLIYYRQKVKLIGLYCLIDVLNGNIQHTAHGQQEFLARLAPVLNETWGQHIFISLVHSFAGSFHMLTGFFEVRIFFVFRIFFHTLLHFQGLNLLLIHYKKKKDRRQEAVKAGLQSASSAGNPAAGGQPKDYQQSCLHKLPASGSVRRANWSDNTSAVFLQGNSNYVCQIES